MIQVINRAFDIIEFVARDTKKDYALSEIADALKLNHATCANILKTMVERNYLEQTGYKKGYRLGHMMQQITGNNSYEQELMNAATDEMEKLTQKMNETSLLAVLRKNTRIALHHVNANRDLMVKSSVEKLAYDSASGRFLVAMLDDQKLDEFLRKYGLPSTDIWKEASTERSFKNEIQKIRRVAYATQTTKTHIVGIATGIAKGKQTVASLSMYLPESRCSEKVLRDIIVQLHKTSELIGRKISLNK